MFGTPARRRVALAAATIVVVAVAAFVSIGASSAAPDAQPASTSDGTPARTVTGNGSGTVTGTPDTMTLQLGVDTRGRTVGDALGKNSDEAAKLVQVLRFAGVEARHIQTSNFSISPVTADNGRQVTGYEVTDTMTVTIRDLGKVGDIVDRSIGVAPDDIVVNGLSFSIDDNSKLVTAARAAAVKQAKDQASQLASAAGVELGPIQTITETSEPSPRPVTGAGDSAAAAVTIQPGSQELTVQVSVVYSIK
jgi:uncharacterized protein